jgi:hypothetical protein
MTPAAGIVLRQTTRRGDAFEMSNDGAAVTAGDGSVGRAASLPYDISVAHQARVYNYVLGSKVDVLHTP